jgi:hypothetical protein
MKASEYIKALQNMIAKHGDCEVGYLGERGWCFFDESDPPPKAVKLDIDAVKYHQPASISGTTIFDLFPNG